MPAIVMQTRTVTLISRTDGNSYTFEDDGVEQRSVNGHPEIMPRGRRNQLLHVLGKRTKQGKPVYYSGERNVDEKTGKVTYKGVPLEAHPQIKGDPIVAQCAVLDTEAIDAIKAAVAKRAETELASKRISNAEVVTFLKEALAKPGKGA